MIKNSFRVVVLILLIILVIINLHQRKEAKEFVIQKAERELEAVPVSIIPVKRAPRQISIKTAGRVKSASQVFVVSKTAGNIQEILVTVGSKVKEGQVLAVIDDYYLKEQAGLAIKAYEQDLKDLKRLEKVSETGAIAGQQIEQFRLKAEASRTKMEMAKTRLSEAVIKAPSSGVVNQLFTKKGNAIGPGKPLCEIVGEAIEIIEAGIDERHVQHLQVGIPAILSDFGIVYPITGTLNTIGVKADRLGRVPLELVFDPNETFHQGLLVDITFNVSTDTSIYIPRTAIITKGGSSVVFVHESNVAKESKITVGEVADEYVEILDGLAPGSQLIVDGNHLLADGQKVKVVKDFTSTP